MVSTRHRIARGILEHDGHRLTRAGRAKLGLPDRPTRKVAPPPPFPASPGEYVWFALTTLPQGEAKAVQELSRLGFAAFNPTEIVIARASRMVKFKRKERERAMLTSMVLAGFPGALRCRRVGGVAIDYLHADVPWLRVLDCDHVTGFVGMGRAPVPVPTTNVLLLRARCGHVAATRNWSPSVGDQVEVSYGAFEGQSGEVVELADGRAMVRLFGAGVLAALSKPLDVPETWVKQAQDV